MVHVVGVGHGLGQHHPGADAQGDVVDVAVGVVVLDAGRGGSQTTRSTPSQRRSSASMPARSRDGVAVRVEQALLGGDDRARPVDGDGPALQHERGRRRAARGRGARTCARRTGRPRRRGGTSRPTPLKTGFEPDPALARRSRTMAPMSRAHESSSGHSTTSASGQAAAASAPSPGSATSSTGSKRPMALATAAWVALAASNWPRHMSSRQGQATTHRSCGRPLGGHRQRLMSVSGTGTASSSSQGRPRGRGPETPACPMRRRRSTPLRRGRPPTRGPACSADAADDRPADRGAARGRPSPAGPAPGPASRARPRSARWRSTRSGSRCW